jgi:hypothetical protein
MFRALILTLLLAPALAFGQITIGTRTTDDNFSGTSVTPTDAGGTHDIAVCVDDNTDGTWSTPSGWTKIDEQAGAGSFLDFAIYYNTGGGGGETFTYSGTAGSQRCSVYPLSGDVDATTVLDVTYSSGSHFNYQFQDGGLSACSAITTNTDGAMVLCFQTFFDGSFTQGLPSGYTSCGDDQSSNRVIQCAYKIVSTAGTETPGAWTHTSVNATATGYYFTIAIKPASAAGGAATRRRRL